ncbi:DUF1772-domain-containing protein [Aureobasidium pullulans]|uniref:DUF1772-domain-containing protein n=3 Tax=Aureobasidium pullulans TaxID=5580 RepID=A0A074XG23_AURPU|nr:DUF1772-domain-containing protein [Aureobasidium pullulans EXF-150]KAG2165974.1 hypothetical protein JADG_005713 [Aureobasidium pullulans]KEQ84465.1 DUF1772-domain-containing protein [Aureobasidium pullulans EXF-150]THV72385.1 DUF1772-domain-containing protein [Aureobasidium pullulans]THV94803.1 DUF1772-domain-containing protein [Aureobasidium pullulans]THV96624.1 DUF1772-domain-containing protein [Aureobasidium pullulans]
MNSIPISATRPSTSIRVAQVVGLTASAYLAGSIGSISWQSVPALMDAPAPLLAKQWKKIFDQGKVAAPPMAVISAAIFGGLAYREPVGSSNFNLYTAAALLVPSIVPYTVFLMSTVNSKLQEKASSLASASLTDTAVESGAAEGETAHELLEKWATLNLGRSLLPLIGTLAAGWAIVDKFEVLGLGASLKLGADRMG